MKFTCIYIQFINLYLNTYKIVLCTYVKYTRNDTVAAYHPCTDEYIVILAFNPALVKWLGKKILHISAPKHEPTSILKLSTIIKECTYTKFIKWQEMQPHFCIQQTVNNSACMMFDLNEIWCEQTKCDTSSVNLSNSPVSTYQTLSILSSTSA